MRTRITSPKDMVAINPEEVKKEIRSHGYTLMRMSMMLLPDYEYWRSYDLFRHWMKNGRMPKKEHDLMRRFLDGTV